MTKSPHEGRESFVHSNVPREAYLGSDAHGRATPENLPYHNRGARSDHTSGPEEHHFHHEEGFRDGPFRGAEFRSERGEVTRRR